MKNIRCLVPKAQNAKCYLVCCLLFCFLRLVRSYQLSPLIIGIFFCFFRLLSVLPDFFTIFDLILREVTKEKVTFSEE